MSPLASTFISLALAAYTMGVWAERIQKRLKWWHFGCFVLGLVFDTLGTGLMFDYVGGMTADVHGISGLIAILLMVAHAVWAFVVLRRGDDAALANFHRLSVFVWAVWLIPYFSPMFFALEG